MTSRSRQLLLERILSQKDIFGVVGNILRGKVGALGSSQGRPWTKTSWLSPTTEAVTTLGILPPTRTEPRSPEPALQILRRGSQICAPRRPAAVPVRPAGTPPRGRRHAGPHLPCQGGEVVRGSGKRTSPERGLSPFDLRGDDRFLANEAVEEPIGARNHGASRGKTGEGRRQRVRNERANLLSAGACDAILTGPGVTAEKRSFPKLNVYESIVSLSRS